MHQHRVTPAEVRSGDLNAVAGFCVRGRNSGNRRFLKLGAEIVCADEDQGGRLIAPGPRITSCSPVSSGSLRTR